MTQVLSFCIFRISVKHNFFHWTLWWSFPRSLGWGGRWVRKNIFLTPVLCDPPFSSFSHPNHTGGGRKPGHATTTGKPNRQLVYPGQLKPWFAGIRYDPRQLMKRSKKGQINIKQIQFKSARDTGKFFIDILSHLFEIYVL